MIVNRNRLKSFMIANPMYDTAFDRLMEDDAAVKFFIGTLLEQEVISINSHPQSYEQIAYDNERTIEGLRCSINRLNFIATVKTKEGESKKIFVDVQKAYEENALIRLRNYIEYKRENKLDGELTDFPIITIYLLDFDLNGVDYPCIKVEQGYINLLNHQPVNVKSSFMEKLPHDSYVIQTRKISLVHYVTKLEQLLGLFEQPEFRDYNSDFVKRYNNLQSDDEDIQPVISILFEIAADPDERKEIENEAEFLRTFDDMYWSELREMDKAIEEKRKAFEELLKQLAELKDK